MNFGDKKKLDPSRDPVFIIAEVAQAHDGSLGMAHAFIDAIAKTGASAVKFQTHIADQESSPLEPWRVKFSYQDGSRYEYWKRMEFTELQWKELKDHAEKVGLVFLSTPFSLKAAEMLERLGMIAWKIASGEISNTPLMDYMLSTGKTLLLSTGMSSWKEIEGAVARIQKAKNEFVLFQCSTKYPCPPESVGLNVLKEYQDRFSCAVGLSDHSGTIFPCLAATTLGAKALEVHVTMSREAFGPDVVASIDFQELKTLVEGVRFLEKTISSPISKDAVYQELMPLRKLFMKSLFATRDLPAGTILQENDLIAKKPGTGIPARYGAMVIGKKLKTKVGIGDLLSLDGIEGFSEKDFLDKDLQ